MKMDDRRWVGLGGAAFVAALLVVGVDVAAQEAKKTRAVKAASPCKGLDEKACKGKAAECLWIVPAKGKQKPYCRLRPASKKKP